MMGNVYVLFDDEEASAKVHESLHTPFITPTSVVFVHDVEV